MPKQLFPDILLIRLFQLKHGKLDQNISALFQLAGLSCFLKQITNDEIRQEMPPFRQFFQIEDRSGTGNRDIIMRFIQVYPFDPVLFRPKIKESV